MDNQIPDLPTVPVQAVKPFQKKPGKRWLIIGIIAGGLVALCVVISAVAIAGGRPPSSQASNTRSTAGTSTAATTNQQTNNGAPGTPAAQTNPQANAGTPNAPDSTPTPNRAIPSTTKGTPHLGGPFSDFVGKYGTPTDQGDANSQVFWADPQQTIQINVSRNEQGEVTELTVLGPKTWDAQQAKNYCAQFLPQGATQFNTGNNLISYHSSMGDIALSFQTTSCALAFTQK